LVGCGVRYGFQTEDRVIAVSPPPTFFLTAAEHSGDALGEALICALRRRVPDAKFVGVGGERVERAGGRLIANPVGRSAMFLQALVMESWYWVKVLRLIKRELAAVRPSVVIPIDSSAINLRIAAVAKERGVAVCYYVAPQVWASRPWRVKKVRERVDTLCCVLPFEEAYFRERGVNAVYVGHPMFDTPVGSQEPEARSQNGGGPRVAIFPGSRRAEIEGHMGPMLEILSEIKGRFPAASFVAVAPSEERAWQIRRLLRGANVPVEIRVGEGREGDAVIRWADLVLVKSGTVTLQVARQHKAMVVIFSVAWWKWHLFAKFFITTRFISLVNILAGRQLVPEFIPFYGSPLPVARKCVELLNDAGLRAETEEQLVELVGPLYPRGGVLAADRVAEEVAKLMTKFE